MTKKLLLTSVIQPFGPRHGDGFGVSYEGSHQIMWAQGIFRPRATTTQWGIDFIAANLRAPTTTLNYPTMDRFIAEVKKGYDYVGIAFVSTTMHKMIPMVEAVRKHAPRTQIILGGYGTALGDEIAQYGDHICKGEGVAFMRSLLGEPVDAPVVQPIITQDGSLFSMPVLGKTGYVFAGLGCPSGCDFCATSHYFKRKHIRLLPDGGAILDAIKRLRVLHPELTSFWINDEDFLINEKRAREFLAAIRASHLPPLAISVFASVKALSKFQPSELVEMGIDWIWCGFEGKRAGYAKQDGRPYPELFDDLHRHGISVMTSMIIGFDYQTPEIIAEEAEELFALRPTMTQFLIYGPAHGTPLYARMKEAGRLTAQMDDHAKHDGFALCFDHPHIGREQMEATQKGLYHEEFRRLGPSVFRVAEDWLNGYENLRDHASPRVRAKAAKYGADAHRAMMLMKASERYLEEPGRSWLVGLQRRLAASTGPLTGRERLISKVVPAMLKITDFKMRHELGQQPEYTRRTYRM
jgi:haloalkane dehalogenase